jgi:hypothetical protein
MDEHRDIYTKPEPRAEEPKNLPAYDLAPEDARAHGRKRSIYSISIMVVLLSLAAFYFYSQESGFDTNPLAELLRGLDWVQNLTWSRASPERPTLRPRKWRRPWAICASPTST